ncbi:exported protein [Mycobacterium bohemicum DSM 44277]|uniref:Haemophore haem-binding domain-containing protein n=2 Tax=Mycobacterium bohemicum TaxID=56425 RepID=A0A1X1QYD2_MYCBE|nr:hypothetical protein [Mycobacterium bohemicum]MCV6971742.1 hypothetical protein [Mycobacterium bohemicum]ORU96461.1 hypothetical protein AWB93_21215 [Mycobacterium bohemicum]CPR11205.1 exported protein [Mycobacterium bohemicum DSM 44277]
MTVTPKTAIRRGVCGLIGGSLLSAAVAGVIAVPVANAAPQCDQNQTVGQSINAYLLQHPDLHRQLEAKSEAEGGNGNVIDYLNRHPDVRQHLIDLSQQCVP